MVRIGGLIISRKAGEEILLLDQQKKTKRVVKVEKVFPNEGPAIVSLDGYQYEMHIGDSFGVDDGGVYLESVEGGRIALRLIIGDSTKILRSELLK